MKLLLSTFCTLLYISIFAQGQLVNKIPQDANAVVHAKGNKFLENISLQELSKTNLGDSILNEMFGEKRNGKNFNDLGINFTSDFFYFNQTTDSINYIALLFSISDANKFEELLKIKQGKNNKIKQQGAIKEFQKNNTLILWDNEKAMVVSGDYKNSFFSDSINAARYGIKEVNYSDFYYPEDSIVMREYSNNYEEIEDSPIEVADSAAIAITNIPGKSNENYDETVVETEAVIDSYNGEYRVYHDEDAYDKAIAKQDSLKALVNERWLKEYAYRIYYINTTSSITENLNYKKMEDKEAAVIFFVTKLDNPSSYYYGYPRYYRSLLEFIVSPIAMGTKGLNGKLYLRKEGILLKSAIEVNEKYLEQYKQLYNYKLNKKFYQYIDEDKVVGFASIALNTEKYVELFPKRVSNLYKDEAYKEEGNEELANFIEEFLTIILDQKAIAQVVRGDALFLLNGLSARESTYKTYEYEEDTYDSKEVEKTKKETLPEFLFMVSSDNPTILEILLKYGMKKGIVSLEDGIYTIQDKDYKTYKFYLLIKDGIVFVGTSSNDISNIKNGTYVAKIGKKQKELLSKNSSVVYFDPKKIVNQVSIEEFDDIKKFVKTHNLLDEMGISYAKYTGISENYINTEITLETTEKDENSLKYFLKMVEILADF
ncbi:hypothetical protein ETU09_06525 [Apibacter muscae]|uniref:DUF4836 family protein n=1 Tax=Apibacter muscae TaxID=2509004 RepID=A0A563DCC6_9FLAO|nr:hypothetical protein [Apibacter muscae]TWP27747.1 hypothetical protein ETU09_06525 [Apibacter muscae]